MFSVQEQIKHDQLAGVSNDISVLADLEDDWDAEGASAVNVTCIAEAKSFITLLECEATNERSEWILPTVNPTVDGGLQLYWFTPWGQTAITFRSGRQEVEVQRKQLNETGEFRSVPVTEAVKIAVRAMRGA